MPGSKRKGAHASQPNNTSRNINVTNHISTQKGQNTNVITQNQQGPPKDTIPSQPGNASQPNTPSSSLTSKFSNGGPWQNTLSNVELHLLGLLERGTITTETPVRILQALIAPHFKCSATTLGLSLKRAGAVMRGKGPPAKRNRAKAATDDAQGDDNPPTMFCPDVGIIQKLNQRIIIAPAGESELAPKFTPCQSLAVCATRTLDANATSLILSLLPTATRQIFRDQDPGLLPLVTNTTALRDYALPPPPIAMPCNVMYIGVIDGFTSSPLPHRPPRFMWTGPGADFSRQIQALFKPRQPCELCQPPRAVQATVTDLGTESEGEASAEEQRNRDQDRPSSNRPQRSKVKPRGTIPDTYAFVKAAPTRVRGQAAPATPLLANSKKRNGGTRTSLGTDVEVVKVILAATENGVAAYTLVRGQDYERGCPPLTLTDLLRFVNQVLVPELHTFYSLHSKAALEDQRFLAILDPTDFGHAPETDGSHASPDLLKECRDALMACNIGTVLLPSHEPCPSADIGGSKKGRRCFLEGFNPFNEMGALIRKQMYAYKSYPSKRSLEMRVNIIFTDLYNHDLKDFFDRSFKNMAAALASLAQCGIRPSLDLVDYLPYAYVKPLSHENLNRDQNGDTAVVESERLRNHTGDQIATSTALENLEFIMNGGGVGGPQIGDLVTVPCYEQSTYLSDTGAFEAADAYFVAHHPGPPPNPASILDPSAPRVAVISNASGSYDPGLYHLIDQDGINTSILNHPITAGTIRDEALCSLSTYRFSGDPTGAYEVVSSDPMD